MKMIVEGLAFLGLVLAWVLFLIGIGFGTWFVLDAIFQ